MRTDKLITIIFSAILGLIGLFTIYILGSSFLYDAGVIGGSENYESLESLIEEESNITQDTAEVSEEDLGSGSQSLSSENEIVPSQDNESEETVKFEDVPEEPQNRKVQEPERTPASRNRELTPPSTTVRTSASSGSVASRKARYEELKKKFNYGTDASGAGWFVHEAWDNPGLMRNALICHVSQNGEISLATQYIGEQRIYHSQAQIQAGRNSMTTVEASENDIDYSSVGGNIKERVQYRAGNNKAILEQIAANMQSNVSVTLLGNDEVEFSLDNTDKQALRECKEMAELLSYL